MKEPSTKTKNIIITFGILLVILPWIDLGFMKTFISSSIFSNSSSSFTKKSNINYKTNPELSFWERKMCTGHKRALGCPERGLHPTEETRKEFGLDQTKGKIPKREVTMNLRDIAPPR